ncbi:MAG: hypothetical protein FWB96_08295 [Defluviitaleaceae bacterium]|nr:hypothetical protein [Defluviitaleaceae bacterium]MCL2224950.1 hypothetical protein [Defluviitaleaceae bacterium]MCL2262489.1 hypothetical protein [Defluviitaleaceae bacterium]
MVCNIRLPMGFSGSLRVAGVTSPKSDTWSASAVNAQSPVAYSLNASVIRAARSSSTSTRLFRLPFSSTSRMFL